MFTLSPVGRRMIARDQRVGTAPAATVDTRTTGTVLYYVRLSGQTQCTTNGEGQAMGEIRVSTRSRTELVDITGEVQRAVTDSGVSDGVCHVYVPHTTAGITINENADPSVRHDILMELNKIVPLQDNYRHLEGNAAAHIKASVVGSSETIPVAGGRLLLGTWQGIFFCEFDGPRSRRVITTIS
jgi:secondary thiamine-phosphate synthase enzyme